MSPLRRDGRASHRFLPWRIGLFFLGAGTWLGGMLADLPAVTNLAILILAAGLILGLVARRLPDRTDEPEER